MSDHTPRQNREFYIGYEARTPAQTARFLRNRVLVMLALGVGVAATLSAQRGPLPAKVFEFGVEREFIGWVREFPVPRLLVPDPGGSEISSYLLTQGGTKFGGAGLSAGYDGAQVRVRGALIYRGDHTMLDLNPESLERIEGEAAPVSTTEDLGDHRLLGEIVDSKCYFGVMNPATGKVHRACAARCISSGNPPIFVVNDPSGRTLQFLLVGPKGEGLHQEVLPYVAEPVAIEGRVTRIDHLLVLSAAPQSIERL